MKTCSMHGREKPCQVSATKPQGQKTVGGPRHRCLDNNKMDLKEIGWESVHWIYLVQERDQLQVLRNMVRNFLVP